MVIIPAVKSVILINYPGFGLKTIKIKLDCNCNCNCNISMMKIVVIESTTNRDSIPENSS